MTYGEFINRVIDLKITSRTEARIFSEEQCKGDTNEIPVAKYVERAYSEGFLKE